MVLPRGIKPVTVAVDFETVKARLEEKVDITVELMEDDALKLSYEDTYFFVSKASEDSSDIWFIKGTDANLSRMVYRYITQEE